MNNNADWHCVAPHSLFVLDIIFQVFWMGSPKKEFRSKFVPSQIWCYHFGRVGVWVHTQKIQAELTPS